jgi:quercetin dioxygenase-like cupin family protein
MAAAKGVTTLPARPGRALTLRRRFRASAAIGVLGILAVVGSHAAAAPGRERVTPLLRAALSDMPGRTLTAVVVDYAPGGISIPHHHAGSVFAYVLAGAIRSQNTATGGARVYHAGESFFEPAGSIHLVSANASSTAPARLLAVFVAPTNAKLTTPQERQR